MKPKRELITVEVDPGFKRKLRIAAANRDLNPSEFVRAAVSKEIEESIASPATTQDDAEKEVTPSVATHGS